MKLKDLIPNPKNPRTISDEALEKLKNSINEFPKMMRLRPIIIDSKNNILGGNQRFFALKLLGFKEIPDEWVMCADDLTKDEIERFIILDNVPFGEFDWDILQSDWELETLENWGFNTEIFKTDGQLVGFDRPEFDSKDDAGLAGKPNKNWLYIEYYHYTDEQFLALTEQIADLMVTAHQIDADKFVEIINYHAKNKKTAD